MSKAIGSLSGAAEPERSRWRRFLELAREAVGWEVFAHLARKKRVPVHRYTSVYYFGGMALFLFGIQVFTGILLVLYYRPSSAEAYESVQYIMAEVPFGWLIRSIHAWAANLFIAVVVIHLLTTFFTKAYRSPREATWISGAFLLMLALGFGFSGYLLPWNTLSYFATKVGTDVPAQLPVIGPLISRVMRGGSDVTGATLSRFYGIHVAVLPAIATALIAIHVFLVQHHGMSVPPSVEKKGPTRTMSFAPEFVLRDMVGWLVAVGLLAALAAFFPWELGEKADPFASAPAGIRPEWYFLATFQALKYFPGRMLGLPGELIGIALFGVIAAVFVLVPLLDRGASAGRSSPWWNRLAVLALAVVAFLTILALRK